MWPRSRETTSPSFGAFAARLIGTFLAHLRSVAAAVHPASDADAGKRIFDAAKPLKEAGVGTLAALEAVAEAMRAAVTRSMVKGEVSTELTARMSPPYLRFCRSCNTTHLYELPFRLAALQAGLELQPDTSPPVLRPIPRVPSGRAGLLSPRRRPGLLAPARAGNAGARGELSRRSGKRGQGAMARRHHGGNSRARDAMGVESRRRATR
jgi:hypothetical protein